MFHTNSATSRLSNRRSVPTRAPSEGWRLFWRSGRVFGRLISVWAGGPVRGLSVGVEDLAIAAGHHLRPGLAQRGDQFGGLLLGGRLQERRQRSRPGLGVLVDERGAAVVRGQIVRAAVVLPGDAACHRVPRPRPVRLVGAPAGLEREHLLLVGFVDLDGAGSINCAPSRRAAVATSRKVRDDSDTPEGGVVTIDHTGIWRMVPSGPLTFCRCTILSWNGRPAMRPR